MLMLWTFRALYVGTLASVPFALAGFGMDFASVSYGCFVAISMIASTYIIGED